MKKEQFLLGLDIGSIAISLAQIRLHSVPNKSAAIDSDFQIIKTAYQFHAGDIRKTLEKILENFDLSQIQYFALTSSCPDFIKSSARYDSRLALIKAVKSFYKKTGSILMVGGEKFALYLFDEDGNYLNYRSNTSCASGTGSFLDQQALRLNLQDSMTLSGQALKNAGEIPKIATRCSVFAKTDLIHSQQEGYTLEQICDGLCQGLARNLMDTLFQENEKKLPIIFAGGVSKNKAVAKHLESMLGIKLSHHKYSHIFGAIGTALLAAEELAGLPVLKINSVQDIIRQGEKGKKYFYEPLELNLSQYPEFTSHENYLFQPQINPFLPVEVDQYQELKKDKSYQVYLGIDIGSTSSKAILMDHENILAGFYTRTSGKPAEALKSLLEAIADLSGRSGALIQILASGTTGSGRKLVGGLMGADLIIDEISAHARAAIELDPEVDTIIEIGGQDSKFTTLKNGMVTFSIMNNTCAAGTGSFLEEQANKLGIPVAEYSQRTEKIQAPFSSDRCTVFMERDLNYYLIDGFTINEVLASAIHSVRENYLSKVARQANIGNKIFFQGATAKNKALVAAFEQKLAKPMLVSKYCHLTGALGVALYLKEQRLASSKFKGIELFREKFPQTTQTCDFCTNHCKIKSITVQGDSLSFGFMCGRDSDTKKHVPLDHKKFNLLKVRKKVFSMPPVKAKPFYDFSVGIPASLYLLDELPLWEKFFQNLGIRTITSLNYQESIKDGKKIAQAEFCAPLASLFGHTRYLTNKADFVFLPFYFEEKNKDRKFRRQFCYYSQYAPSIISLAENINGQKKILTPIIRSLNPGLHMKMELYETIKKMGPTKSNFLQVSRAYDEAATWFQKRKEKLSLIFKEELKKNQDISVLFLGRPYTALSPAMNSNILDLFIKNDIPAFYQDMLAHDHESHKSLEPLLEAFHWNYAAKILEAADVTAKTQGLYPVLVTSFKCSPDSFVIEYFQKIFDARRKPYLILQLDEYNSNVGYETRIEAGIRAFRNHFNSTSPRKKIAETGTYNNKVVKNFSEIRNKTILLPSWDPLVCKLLEANLKGEGMDVRMLEESTQSIQKGLRTNNGQCIPLNAIAQNCADYVEKYQLDPAKTVLWNIDASVSCNIRLFPYYIKNIFESQGNGMEKVDVYTGDLVFSDVSIATAVNTYFVYMFGGLLRKMGCATRPYENIQGSTDQVIKDSLEIFYTAFLNKNSKEDALKKVVALFANIPLAKTDRPKVAIFGDLYVRDNDVFNQNIIQSIEENGGEVITTPYSEYGKIVIEPYIKKWLKEGAYTYALRMKVLGESLKVLEKKYYKYFNKILKKAEPTLMESIESQFFDLKNFIQETKLTELMERIVKSLREKKLELSFKKTKPTIEEKLSQFHVNVNQSGESMDNILKIMALAERHPDLSLFVQTNPAFCCPSLVTEAMSGHIEKITGIPVATITYDGTGGFKNHDLIPYLKYPRTNLLHGAKKAH